MNKKFKIFNQITIGIFLLLVLGNIFYPKKDYSSLENRYLQKFPSVSLQSLGNGTFMKQFENFVSDQLMGRNFLVKKTCKCRNSFGKKRK